MKTDHLIRHFFGLYIIVSIAFIVLSQQANAQIKSDSTVSTLAARDREVDFSQVGMLLSSGSLLYRK